MIGQRFGSLVAVAEAPARRGRHRYFECLCDCGGVRVARVDHLSRGATISCGCFRRRPHKHGEASRSLRTPEYIAWKGMIARCTNPRNARFAGYGGRGIAVCDEWRVSFESFLEHVGRRPSPGHSLDRRDNARGYEPGNVRWATRREQSENRRNTRLIVGLSAAAWARATGVPGRTIRKRLDAGWDPLRAATATSKETDA